jgi:hypothetical protein
MSQSDRGTTGSGWAARILNAHAFDELASRLPASAVWSVLLEVVARRAAARTPIDLLRQWERDPFCQPATVDQRVLVELDGHLLAAASLFEAIELSPLAPLGACSVVARTSQNRIVSALRGTEVLADPTNLLALEAAHRLRQDRGQVVRLATCHRCVRAQPVPKQPGFTQHFRLFCLASAGAERPDHGFVIDELVAHITTHLAALDRLEQHGYLFPDRQLVILAGAEQSELGDRVARRMEVLLPTSRAPLVQPYYDGLRFTVNVRHTAGAHMPIIDGGRFDWLGALAANRKLSFVASGLGSQLAAYAFRAGGLQK